MNLWNYYQLCDIENNLLKVFNKLNNSEYINGIVNLSSHSLTDTEISVLSKGLGLCPTQGTSDIGNIIQDLDVFKRRIRLQLFFSGSNQDPTERHTQSGLPFEHKSFKLKSSFNPVGSFQLESMFYSIEQDLHSQKYREPKKKNLTKEEYKAIRSLNKNENMIIKPADIGSAIVILNKQSCINEGQRQLHSTQFYEETDLDLTGEVIHRINSHAPQSTCNYLTTDTDRAQQFYLLPQINKDPLGRPVVWGSGGPTEKISQLADHFIGPLVPLLKSHIRDSTHLKNILNNFTVQSGMLLCTLDITSLYTNIPHNEGTQSNKEMLAIHKPPDSLPQNSYIRELLEVVLTNNHFEFNGKHYHQVSGTGMGTKLASLYANLFMTKFEEKYVYTYPQQPKLWKRFIDDIFLIWPHGMDWRLKFIEHLNTVHPTIKFTSDISHTEIFFLDLTIYISNFKLYTRLYTKTTDRHMYLNYSSEHPMSLKRSIPYSQLLRLKRLHSEPQYLLEAQIHIYLFFIQREYPHDVVLNTWMKTNRFTREQLLTPVENSQSG